MSTVLSDAELDRLLQDDTPCGDLTTESLGIGAAAGRLDFRARGSMVVCGTEEAARLLELAGARVLWRVGSGTALGAGERMLVVEGAAAALHRAWKTAQTLLLFAEHRLFLDEAPALTVARLRRAQPEKKTVVEVGDVAEAVVWAQAGVDLLVTSAPFTAAPRDVQVDFFRR